MPKPGAREPAARVRAGLLTFLLTILSMAGAATPASAELVGSVSGTVRTGGEPVANAWVTLMPVTPTGDWAGLPAQTTTDQDGRYEFGELYTHHVKVQVRAPSFSGLAGVYWPDAYSFATAVTLRVAPSGSTADVDLPVGGSISGWVVDADTGAPIVGARVAAHVDAPPGWESVGAAGLAPGPGQFVIQGLPPTPVALQARAGEGSNHLGQWYDGAGFYGAAERVEPGTSDLVIRLREGGQVSGVVRDDRGAAVPGAAVTLVGCPALCPLSATADGSGSYRINGVPSGPGLRAYAAAGEAGLLSGWYAGPEQTGDTTFDLDLGQVRSDLDFALTKGAVVVGRILDGETGEPLRGVSVELVDVDNPLSSYVSRDVEEPGGKEFEIGPVPPGQYSLIVYPGRENGDYLPVALVASSGLDGPGRLDLSRGERAGFTMSLARQRMAAAGGAADVGSSPAAPPGGQADPVLSAGWPGLFGGFLVPEGPGFLRLGA